MAFTAIHPEAGILDATRADLGCGLPWEAVHRVRPRVPLACPECGYGVHAKRSPRRVRYFAHDPGKPRPCSLSNESMEHHLLKLELATAIRTADWHAQLEVSAPDGTWRADVMATSPDGTRRMAWEAQLSPITTEAIAERTARYEQDGIDVCWVTDQKGVPWMGSVPSLRVRPPDGAGAWLAEDGLARFDYRAGSWVLRPYDLPPFVRLVLGGVLQPCEVLSRYRRVRRTDRSWVRRRLLWTDADSMTAQSRHEQMRQRQEAWKRQQEALQAEREAEAARVRQEQEKVRKREEEARRQEAQARMQAEHTERMRRWAEENAARRAREEAERQERERQARIAEQERQERERADAALSASWWGQLSPAQEEELFGAVAALALEELSRGVARQDRSRDFADGVPVYAMAGRLYGVVRPCPELVRKPDEWRGIRVFVRNAREADLLAARGLRPEQVDDFGLPDHEQIALY